MKMHKRVVSMILIIGFLAGNLFINPVEASMVEVKTNSSNAELRISLLNDNLDCRLNELAFEIKNKTNQKIKIAKVSIQAKVEGEWKTLQKRNKLAGKRKIIMTAKSKVYDSIVLNNDYIIPKEGLETGKYSVYIKYKYNGEYLYHRKTFHIEGLKSTGTDSEQETTHPYGGDVAGPSSSAESSEVSKDSTIEASKPSSIKIKLVNIDFSINKKGRAYAMVFSEADYKKAKKTKIYISIQRKVKSKWKKYKSYNVVKNSNIAFINKQLKLKKKGTYRMWVKVTFYDDKKLRKQYKAKSKVQVY